MVIKHVWLGLCFWVWMAALHAADVTVEANIDQNLGQVNFPLHGTVTITHGKGLEIDPKSFTIKNTPLETSFIKKVTLSGDTMISIYNFILPPVSKGEHLLDPVEVKVSGKIYKSTPSSYEVRDGMPSFKSPIVSGIKSDKPAILRLEAFVQGPSSLFLGERTKLVYRISFNRSIDLTKSNLPFVHAKSFQKVGDAHIQDKQEGDITIQEITQEVEAAHLGTFTFGPSAIEGRTYQTDGIGNKVYDSQLLKADAPVIEITVHPFPPDKQPPSFNGALGVIQAEVLLATSSKISVGDTIELEVVVRGVENLADLQLPPLLCQPGFSGFFQINDLPPAAQMEGKEKTFQVELRPLTPFAKEIPSIEFSSFDPETKNFHVIRTKAIALKVEPGPIKSEKEEVLADQSPPTEKELLAMLQHPAPPLEIKGSAVDHLQIPFLQRGWILVVIPIGISLLFLQMYWKKTLDGRPNPQIKPSERLFKQAEKARPQPAEALKLLEQALRAYISETGGSNPPAEVLLRRVESAQYGPPQPLDIEKLFQDYRALNFT